MIDLRVIGKVEDGLLKVEYKLENRGTSPLIAFDGAPGAGSPVPDLSRMILVSYAIEDLKLLRVIPQPPPGTMVESARIPLVSQTDPGKSRHVKFSLPVPVREFNDWTPDFKDATYEKHVVPMITLVIGCFWKTPATVLKPAGAPELLRLHAGMEPEQRVQASFRVDVEVEARTDSKFLRAR